MKKIIIVLIPLFVILLVAVGYFTLKPKEKHIGAITYQTLTWTKPATDAQWAEDVKQDGLNIRTDNQLREIKASHEKKLIEKLQPLYDKATMYPDAIRWELITNNVKEPELSQRVIDEITTIKYDYERLSQVVERTNKEIELRKSGKVDRSKDITK